MVKRPNGVKLAISIHSPHTRGDRGAKSSGNVSVIFQSTPLTRGETSISSTIISYPLFQSTPLTRGETLVTRSALIDTPISIHSPHTRGDSISLQKSIRIYVSLHNKTMIHRFSELYKPLFAAQSPIFGVRSPRESHDSFTFARPSDGRGITP